MTSPDSPSLSRGTPEKDNETPKAHLHRCMRCDKEFECQTPGICKAQRDVLPTIVTLGPDGRPRLTEHCPAAPQVATWAEYVSTLLTRIPKREIADRCGVSMVSVDRWLAGKNTPTLVVQDIMRKEFFND